MHLFNIVMQFAVALDLQMQKRSGAHSHCGTQQITSRTEHSVQCLDIWGSVFVSKARIFRRRVHVYALTEAVSDSRLSLSRCGRGVLHCGRSHKPGNEVKVKFFLRRAQSLMAAVKEKVKVTHVIQYNT